VRRAVGDGDAFAARVGRSGKIDWALPIGGDERNRSAPIPGAIMMPASEELTRVLRLPFEGTHGRWLALRPTVT
jgi:hypothetical protein